MKEVAELQDLGFEAAVSEINRKRELKRKYMIAKEHYRACLPEHFERCNKELRSETERSEGGMRVYSKLHFTEVKNYPHIPPDEVLEKMQEAKQRGCFDTFEICTPHEVHERKPDPILFGCINGCPDKFIVASWDNDIRVEDILKENEG